MRPLDEVRGPAELDDHAAEALGRGAARQRLADLALALVEIGRDAAEDQHLGAEREHDLVHALLAPVAREMRDGVMGLERIAGGIRERLVHVGEERRCRQPRAIRHMDEAFGKLLRLVEARHEGAGAPFHVEHQAAEARGELLREDRGGDEIDRFDRRGDVANRIEALVGRRELARSGR